MQQGDKYTYVFELTPDVYNGFIATFKDMNPLHTDKQFAISKGFKSEVMHGNILNGFISYFIGECLPEKNVMIYSQKIDFKHPVYLHDKLTLQAKIKDIHESVHTAEIEYYFENRENVKVAKGSVLIGLDK
jgi:3-hydroxybutyryl-CoA dehydratase